VATYPALEHRESRIGRWFRARRLRLALLIGAVETLAIAVTDATWRWALVVAAVVFLFYWFVGRKTRYDAVRQISWTAAASQLLPVLVPVIAALVGFFVIVAVIILAVVMIALLYLDRGA
jgi:hypothetical protein